MRRLWPAGPLLAVAGILVARWARHPLEAYGDSAAHLIEHLARVRLLLRLEELTGGPLARLVALDGLYPPGLPLAEAAFGAVVGHAPERVVLLGLGWLALLVGAVGRLGRHLGAGWPAAVAVALVPALQGAALRSYPDLPMTALLWAAVAALAQPGRGRALAGAALLLAASLVKWTALPYGAVMLAGLVAWRGRPALGRVGLAAALWGAGVAACLGAGMGSLSSMGGATFQPPPGVAPPDSLAAVPWLAAAWAQLAATDLARLAFYPARLVTSVLSPVGALAALAGIAAWARRGAPAAALVAVVPVGQVAFLLLLVPPLDDRFLLTLAPAVALAAGAGLARHPRLGGLAVLALLAVSVDAHLRPPVDPVPAAPPGQRDAALEGRAWTPRLGLSSSIDRRGWSRSADLVSHRGGLERDLWRRLRVCGGGGVDGPERALSAAGDLNRWTLMRLRDARAGNGPAWRWLGEPGADRSTRRLWVQPLPADAFGPPASPPDGWVLRSMVSDPDGGPAVEVWSAPGPNPCSPGQRPTSGEQDP